MQQKVILHSEQISRKGEIKYFQIPLQGTAIKIIAIEASAFLLTSVPPVAPPAPPTPTNTNCPNPGTASIDPVSDNVAGGIRTQVFRIGAAVNPTFIYRCGVYGVVVSVTAVDGDTPATIASKLDAGVNNITLASWSQYGSNNQNYVPTATANGDLLTVTTDQQHSFFASGSGSCSAATSTQYDPLFAILQNEKAGIVSLQSPDVTDIFLQCEAWRADNNVNYGDFTYTGEPQEEWLKGKKRIATEVSLSTASPILEAYYKDSWGLYHGRDISYGLNIFVWFEKLSK
jgi:hypothetical protein